MQAVGLCAAGVTVTVFIAINHLTLTGRTTPVILYSMQVGALLAVDARLFPLCCGVSFGTNIEYGDHLSVNGFIPCIFPCAAWLGYSKK